MSVNGRLLQTDAKLMRFAEHFSDILKDGQLKRPVAWRDLAPDVTPVGTVKVFAPVVTNECTV